MNEFTKEELELILNDVAQCDMEYSRTLEQEELMFKLQSMIDTYCEHPNKQYYAHEMLYECNDCHMVTL